MSTMTGIYQQELFNNTDIEHDTQIPEFAASDISFVVETLIDVIVQIEEDGDEEEEKLEWKGEEVYAKMEDLGESNNQKVQYETEKGIDDSADMVTSLNLITPPLKEGQDGISCKADYVIGDSENDKTGIETDGDSDEDPYGMFDVCMCMIYKHLIPHGLHEFIPLDFGYNIMQFLIITNFISGKYAVKEEVDDTPVYFTPSPLETVECEVECRVCGGLFSSQRTLDMHTEIEHCSNVAEEARASGNHQQCGRGRPRGKRKTTKVPKLAEEEVAQNAGVIEQAVLQEDQVQVIPVRRCPGRPRGSTSKKKNADVEHLQDFIMTEKVEIFEEVDFKEEPGSPVRRRPGRPRGSTSKKTNADVEHLQDFRMTEKVEILEGVDFKEEPGSPVRRRPGRPRGSTSKKTNADVEHLQDFRMTEKVEILEGVDCKEEPGSSVRRGPGRPRGKRKSTKAPNQAKEKVYKNYTSEEFTEAVRMIKSKELTIKEASDSYKIPYSTLQLETHQGSGWKDRRTKHFRSELKANEDRYTTNRRSPALGGYKNYTAEKFQEALDRIVSGELNIREASSSYKISYFMLQSKSLEGRKVNGTQRPGQTPRYKPMSMKNKVRLQSAIDKVQSKEMRLKEAAKEFDIPYPTICAAVRKIQRKWEHEYTKEDLYKAVEKVTSKELTLNEAALLYHIPYPSLCSAHRKVHHKPKKQYSDSDFQKAMEKVLSKELTLKQAAAEFNVPYPTINLAVRRSKTDLGNNCKIKKLYSDEDFKKALNEITSNGLPIKQASEKFGIPISTLTLAVRKLR